MLLTAIKNRHANHRTSKKNKWTDARRPVPRSWIRSAEVRAEGNIVMRMGTQQRTAKTGIKHHQHVTPGKRFPF